MTDPSLHRPVAPSPRRPWGGDRPHDAFAPLAPAGPLTGLLAAAALAAFVVIPLATLVARTVVGGALLEAIANPTVYRALALSLGTTALSLLVSVGIGTPVAYGLARRRLPLSAALDAVLDLPMVLPPAVAGIALLMTLGRRGIVGATLAAWGIELPFTTAAVVIAQTFVAAPFYIRAARAGFLAVDPTLERISESLGISPLRTFWRVTLPLALPSLAGGAVMCWARALGEFGATIMFAGNFVGRTQTMPLAIYQAMETDLNVALTLATILIVVSLAVLIVFRLLLRRSFIVG